MPKTVITETRLYPVVIHREGNTWGYHSPEFGGGGAISFEDALKLAQELLNSAVAEYYEQEIDAPAPSSPNEIEPDGGQIAWLPVVVSNSADRVSITLPKALIARIDAATNNKSAFFAELARERLSR